MGLNYDKMIQSLLALKAPFRLNLPVFHYQAKCVAPLSSFYWWLVALSLRFCWPNCKVATQPLTRISHAPVRNAHSVPTSVGVSRELRYSSRAGAFAPASCFPSSLRRVTFSQSCQVCEKVRLKIGRGKSFQIAAGGLLKKKARETFCVLIWVRVR